MSKINRSLIVKDRSRERILITFISQSQVIRQASCCERPTTETIGLLRSHIALFKKAARSTFLTASKLQIRSSIVKLRSIIDESTIIDARSCPATGKSLANSMLRFEPHISSETQSLSAIHITLRYPYDYSVEDKERERNGYKVYTAPEEKCIG